MALSKTKMSSSIATPVRRRNAARSLPASGSTRTSLIGVPVLGGLGCEVAVGDVLGDCSPVALGRLAVAAATTGGATHDVTSHERDAGALERPLLVGASGIDHDLGW